MQAARAGVFPSSAVAVAVAESGVFGSSSLMNDVSHAVSVTDCLQHLGTLARLYLCLLVTFSKTSLGSIMSHCITWQHHLGGLRASHQCVCM